VVRGSRQGESHGGVYLVDFERDRASQVLDWNTMAIDWRGRGWDRGLRGIAMDADAVYIAASDELFAYDREFRLLGSWRNRYLKHCHEIFRHERTLFLTSTGFDAVLGFDLDTKLFNFGLHVQASDAGFTAQSFDPEFGDGPAAGNALHLNNVHCEAGGMYLSGLRTGGLLLYNGHGLQRWVTLPEGTHNARPFRDGVLFNDTAADLVRIVTRQSERRFPVPRFAPERLDHLEDGDTTLARQAFARGLCVIGEETIACGSSPSTITLHGLAPGSISRMATLSYDVRNAIHGLAVWPFDWPATAVPLPPMPARR
jgi:hypothetical protein